MNRREFVGLSSSALLSSPAGFAATKAPSPEQPNFLFLIADDLMFRTINAINNPEVRTPNIDRLVRSGCHFTHCFHQGSWTGAVCVASRTMLNTGLTSFRAWHTVNGDQALQIPTWGQTLRDGFESPPRSVPGSSDLHILRESVQVAGLLRLGCSLQRALHLLDGHPSP